MNTRTLLSRFCLTVLAGASAVLSTPANAADKPVRPAETAIASGYRLSIRDTIEVTIFDEPELTAVQQIDTSGQVQLHLIGSVAVAGKTVREVEALVQKLYLDGDFLKRPAATVRVTDYAPREVSVQGEVNTQGMLAFPKERTSLDIVDVISRCGGFTEKANRSKVQIVHISEDGREVSTTVNVDDMMKRGGQKVMVYPGDRIWVPQIFL